MINKFLALLAGVWEQRSDPARFHTREAAEHDTSASHQHAAAEQERERVLRQEEGQAPAAAEILQPHSPQEERSEA